MSDEPVLNFSEDLKAHFIRQLVQGGYNADPQLSLDRLCVQFYNVLARSVESHKRIVSESKEFTCPTQYEAGYDSLKKKIEAGENINPNLSTLLLDADYQDLLLCDWGIHHFHLGQVLNQNGFVTRTGPLLFAHVTSDKFFSIQILDHLGFSDRELVQIIHRNWPEVISPWRLNRVLGLRHSYSGDDVKKLRTAGIQTLFEVEPGVVYGPLGGGYSTAHTSMRVRMQCDYSTRIVHDLEKWVRVNIGELRQQLRDKALLIPDPLRFKLLVEEKGLYALEIQSRVAFLLSASDRT